MRSVLLLRTVRQAYLRYLPGLALLLLSHQPQVALIELVSNGVLDTDLQGYTPKREDGAQPMIGISTHVRTTHKREQVRRLGGSAFC